MEQSRIENILDSLEDALEHDNDLEAAALGAILQESVLRFNGTASPDIQARLQRLEVTVRKARKQAGAEIEQLAAAEALVKQFQE